MLDEYDDEDLFPDEPAEGGQVSGDVGQSVFEQGKFADYARAPVPKSTRKTPAETVKLPPPHLLRPSCRRT